MNFFRSLGFDIPPRKGIPDFLQEVSGKKDQEVASEDLPCYRQICRPLHPKPTLKFLLACLLACHFQQG